MLVFSVLKQTVHTCRCFLVLSLIHTRTLLLQHLALLSLLDLFLSVETGMEANFAPLLFPFSAKRETDAPMMREERERRERRERRREREEREKERKREGREEEEREREREREKKMREKRETEVKGEGTKSDVRKSLSCLPRMCGIFFALPHPPPSEWTDYRQKWEICFFFLLFLE